MFSVFSTIALVLVSLLCLWAGTGWLAHAYSNRPALMAVSERLSSKRINPNIAAWLLLCLAMVLRVLQVAAFSGDTLPENIHTFLQARSLWQEGVSLEGLRWPTVLPGWGGEAEGPLLAWLTMLPQALMGYTMWAVALPMLLLQAVSLWALWDMLRRNVSASAGLWALLLCALSPWQLMQARWPQAWQILPYLLLLSAWMFTKAGKRGIWAIFGMAVLGLAMYTGDTAWYVVPLLVLIVAAYLLVKKLVPLRWLLPGVLLFALVAAPAIYTWAVQTFALPQGTLFGMTVPQLVNYPHTGDLLMQHDKVLSYGPGNLPAQEGYGLHFLPFLRDNAKFASLQSDLGQAAYQAVKASLFQFTDDAGYTTASFLPQWGYFYLFSIPLSLLGVLRYLARIGGARRRQESQARRMTIGLMLCCAIAPLPFLLTHLNLSMTHYAVLFFPLVVVTVYGIIYVTRRIRFSAGVLAVLYIAGCAAFLAGGGLGGEESRTPTFPGLSDALAHTRQAEAEQVVVTTRLYPQTSPAEAAAQKVSWAYQLEPAYIRGEGALPDTLPYDQRFAYVYMPSHTLEVIEGTYYILHESEAYTIDPDPFDFVFFEEYVVLSPKAGSAEAE